MIASVVDVAGIALQLEGQLNPTTVQKRSGHVWFHRRVVLQAHTLSLRAVHVT